MPFTVQMNLELHQALRCQISCAGRIFCIPRDGRSYVNTSYCADWNLMSGRLGSDSSPSFSHPTPPPDPAKHTVRHLFQGSPYIGSTGPWQISPCACLLSRFHCVWPFATPSPSWVWEVPARCLVQDAHSIHGHCQYYCCQPQGSSRLRDEPPWRLCVGQTHHPPALGPSSGPWPSLPSELPYVRAFLFWAGCYVWSPWNENIRYQETGAGKSP